MPFSRERAHILLQHQTPFFSPPAGFQRPTGSGRWCRPLFCDKCVIARPDPIPRPCSPVRFRCSARFTARRSRTTIAATCPHYKRSSQAASPRSSHVDRLQDGGARCDLSPQMRGLIVVGIAMQRFECPICSASVAEQDLLRHPPSGPYASRALAPNYCPACGAGVRVFVALRWWHVIAFLGILACAAAVMFLVQTWVGRATVVVAPVLVFLVTRNARRLAAVQA